MGVFFYFWIILAGGLLIKGEICPGKKKKVGDKLNIETKVKDFLVKYRMDDREIDPEQSSWAFIEDMKQGLAGRNSSLEMIPTFIKVPEEIPVDRPVVVLDAGGTNLRTAIIYFNRNMEPVVEQFQQHPMPGSTGEITGEKFFALLADYVKNQVQETCGGGTNIGFCFSYAVQMFPDKDGRLIRLAKEIRISGLEGQLIGAGLKKALESAGCRVPGRVILLNDTVAALLAGKAAASGRLYSSYLGFILGTGTNTSYIEENKRISKLKNTDPTQKMVINVESGGWTGMPRGAIDEIFDSSLKDPGMYLFEKMVAGKYLGNLIRIVCREAAREGIFSPIFSRQLEEFEGLETRELGEYLTNPYDLENSLARLAAAGSSGDREALDFLIDRILERAARLAAVKLASLAIKTGQGTDPKRPVCITTEGTTFHKLKGFLPRVDRYLDQLLVQKRGIHYRLIRVENAVPVGTALAALTN